MSSPGDAEYSNMSLLPVLMKKMDLRRRLSVFF